MYIVDTTLRDGEQKAGIALGIDEKVRIAELLDYVGVSQIEAGTPSMGGTELDSIKKIASLGLKCKVAAWNRMNINDIQSSIDCNVDIIHMSVPASDLHIKMKFNKDRLWVKTRMRACIEFAFNKGFEVHIGLEDASRADLDFLVELCEIAKQEGVSRVRYADTVGVLTPRKIYEDVMYIKSKVNVTLAIHAHNDFGMAVANSLASVRAGVEFVDCTIGGVGERSGNCNLQHLLLAYNQQMIANHMVMTSFKRLQHVQEEILNIFYDKKTISCKAFSLA